MTTSPNRSPVPSPIGPAASDELPVLSRSLVDRATEARQDARHLAEMWSSRGRLLVLDGDLAAPVEPGGEGAALLWAPAIGPLPPQVRFLGDDGTACYFAVRDPAARSTTGVPYRGLREIGEDLGDQDAGLLVHAVALERWHQSHLYCPKCGAPTEAEQGGSVRRCTVDGSEHFPRTDPAMIVLVTDPDGAAAVLGRGVTWPPGRFSCLAGFVEAGESAEQAVAREVAEEVGLRTRAVQYVASQPWPFPASLMLGFRAIADHDPLRPELGEIAEARWFTRDQLSEGMAEGRVLPPPRVSIARHLIDSWLTGH